MYVRVVEHTVQEIYRTSGLYVVEVGWYYNTLQFANFEMLVNLTQATHVASFALSLVRVFLIRPVLEPHQILEQLLHHRVYLLGNHVRTVPGHRGVKRVVTRGLKLRDSLSEFSVVNLSF